MKEALKQGNGEVVVDLNKGGIHIVFTRTPRWAYILISTGIMFALIIWAHSAYRYSAKMAEIKSVAEKLVEDEPLSDEEVVFLDELDETETDKLKKDVQQLKVEQTQQAIQIKIEPRPISVKK